MTSPMRLNPALVAAAERESTIQKRSVPKQIEFWAELGKAVENLLDISDVFAVIQGFKRLKVESLDSTPVDADDVFGDLETDRTEGKLFEKVTGSSVYYEASTSKPGFIDKVDSGTGTRLTGKFENGEFMAVA